MATARTEGQMATAKSASSTTSRKASRRKPAPGLLPFKASHGGARAGAGRKPKVAGRPGVDHRQRAALASRYPVHVTMKLRAGLPRLRSKPEYAVLRAAFAAGCARAVRGALRLCHYAVLNDHLHLLCEAANRTALARGLQGLLIRIAKALNKLWSRRGSVFADRYHDHILTSPREVRNALRYVFGNGKKHAAQGQEVSVPQAMDTFTSAPWFTGFREHIVVKGIEAIVKPVTDPATWMLREGWLKHGRLSVHEVPSTA
jgi:hypothetical protein